MSAWFPGFWALLLQSNDAVARAVEGGGTLKPDLTHYTGMIGIFAAVFLVIIQFYVGIVNDYGFAIIATCLSLRIMLLPLTRMQIRGMKLMQMLAPVQKEIQRFYPDKQDQNSKLMELYSTYKINPLAGCLPMLLQMPILFGVYRALYDPSFVGHNFLGIQLVFPVNLTSIRSYGFGPDAADLIDVTVAQLGLQSQLWHLPSNIPFVGGSFWYWPALVLVVLYAASSLLMQRVMKIVNAPDPHFTAEFQEEMKSHDGNPQSDMAAQMQKQMGLMNVLIILMAFIFSAGALLYFIIQNLAMCLEYWFISKSANVHFDAREMKNFIRKPPPPLVKPGAGAGAAPPPKDSASTNAAKNDNLTGADSSRRKKRKK
jgi:YidC/Oxa1 family membrane protein insertase